ncbi:MAG: hypothetical protein ACYCO4_02160 [Sulfobacillus sp.]
MAELTAASLSVAVELQGTDTCWEADVTVVFTLPSTTVTVPHTVPPACVMLTVRVQLDAAGLVGGLVDAAGALPPQPETNTNKAAPRIIGKRRIDLTSYLKQGRVLLGGRRLLSGSLGVRAQLSQQKGE